MENEILNPAEEGNVPAAVAAEDLPTEAETNQAGQESNDHNRTEAQGEPLGEKNTGNEEVRDQPADAGLEEAFRFADRQYDHWITQGEQLKQVYPGFDLRTELRNPQFGALIRGGVSLDAAYVALHKDEIIPAAMAVAAQAVQRKLANSIAAGGSRPRENGMGHQAPAVVRTDVSRLTKGDIDQVFRRVARGERVSFG